MSEVNDARARLHAQLVAYTADLLDAERVHLYAPTIIASPCLWIGQPGIAAQQVGSPGARVRVVRFGVYALADGYEPQQCALLDELVARIWDAAAALKLGEAIVSVPQPVDVGGTTQRAVVTDVGVTTMASTLCVRPSIAVPPKASAA